MNRDIPNSRDDHSNMPQFEKRINALQENVIEAIAESMSLYRVTPSNAHLYGALLFSEKPMTLDEMGRALEMSKTSMSTGVRALMQLNMIDKVWMKGHRKDYYVVEKDWHQNFIDYFDLVWRDTAKNSIRVLNKTVNELKSLKEEDLSEELTQRVDYNIEKIEYALDYYDWLLRLIDFFKSNEIFDYVPKKTR